MNQRKPVTILTGFLCSGKTTLLNNFIKKYNTTKFAVIENEFGAIGIDSQLISGNPEGIFELANGCICCTLNDDFYATISNLIESSYHYDHLLVETTGIADPLSIVRLFLANSEIQQYFNIDSVICVADVTILEELVEELPEIRRQIAVADTILLNKADLSSKPYIDAAIKILNDINPLAVKHITAFAHIHDLNLLNTNSYSAHATEQSLKTYFQNSSLLRQKLLRKPQINSTQHSDFTSEAFIFDEPFHFNSFTIWMKNFLYFNERTVLRAKGILFFSDKPNKYIFHAVFGSYMLEEQELNINDEKVSKLVFIGKHIDRDEIYEGLRQLTAE